MHDFHDAFVLYRRPYRETSSIVDFWVQEPGLVSAVVKGVHGPGKAAVQKNAWLAPFQPLRIVLHGRGQLSNVYKFEPAGQRLSLLSDLSLTGQYLNEIMLHTLKQYEVEPGLFVVYQQLLHYLSKLGCQEPRLIAIALRSFEQRILGSIGLEVDFEHDQTGAQICRGSYYRFEPGAGLMPCPVSGLRGDLILAVASGKWTIPGVLGTARYLLQRQIEFSLGRQLRVPSLRDSLLAEKTNSAHQG